MISGRLGARVARAPGAFVARVRRVDTRIPAGFPNRADFTASSLSRHCTGRPERKGEAQQNGDDDDAEHGDSPFPCLDLQHHGVTERSNTISALR